jgi:hypothetical protein
MVKVGEIPAKTLIRRFASCKPGGSTLRVSSVSIWFCIWIIDNRFDRCITDCHDSLAKMPFLENAEF